MNKTLSDETLLNEKLFRACTLNIKGIGSQKLRHLIAMFGSAKNAWEAPTEDYSDKKREYPWLNDFLVGRISIDPNQFQDKLNREEILLAIPGDDSYPNMLSEWVGAPPLLFYKGMLRSSHPAIAIVGARRASPYGKAAAKHLAHGISESGYAVISGLARGIDTAAHQGALEAEGITWAVMAGGLDTIYPAENSRLASAIMEKGALISEYPPGSPPEATHFPARNRLISGSAYGVIVVEAAERSGSLITADFALEQGREVFAVPGPIFSELSKGTHQLLRMGAKLAENIQDILSELPAKETNSDALYIPKSDRMTEKNAECKRNNKRNARKTDNTLFTQWDLIMACLSDIPMHIDRLTILCPLPAQEIALGLLELQLAGKILQLPGQHFVLQR
ncbi:DNA-processing protein DprA [Dehalobacter sp. DCM]|uniref:DNA-processing protein DprA n=1 Tax=Dehalobacter sp. DCM TaxID=2907827 RepID=UPI003081F9BE|nr:DNA-processing protein DprA [Dehalobacter sp. DCM]